MNSESEKQLKRHGQAISEVAARRLAQQDFNATIMQQISKKPGSSKRRWPVGLAAAIGLFSVAWLVQQSSLDAADPMPAQATQTLAINLHELPLQVEQSINQTLLKEQQAIIADLKALKAQLLSI